MLEDIPSSTINIVNQDLIHETVSDDVDDRGNNLPMSHGGTAQLDSAVIRLKCKLREEQSSAWRQSPPYVPASSILATPRLVCVLLVYVLCCARAMEQGYLKTPGTVSVIRSGPSLLTFQPALPNNQIYWCYWKYAGCERPEGCPTEPFIGYTIVGKQERENISRRHEGWVFESARKPCQGGIRREKTDQDHKGWYQMIYEDMDRKEFTSDFFPLNVYDSDILEVEMSINNKSEPLTLSGNEHELPSIDGDKNEKYVFTLTLQSELPPDANVRIVRSNKAGTTLVIPRCAGPGNPTCEFDVSLTEEKDVFVEAEVDIGIQGSEVVGIKQAFNYDGVTVCSCSASIAFTVLFFFVALVELAVIGWFLIWPWYQRRSRKKDVHKAKTDSDVVEQGGLLDATTNLNPIMTNRHDKLDDELSTVRELTNKQAIALLDKDKIVHDTQEKSKILQDQLDKKCKEVDDAQSEIDNLRDNVARLKDERNKAPRFMQFPQDVVFRFHEQQGKLTAEVTGNPRPTVRLCTFSRGPINTVVNMSKLHITQDFKEDVYTWIIKEVTKEHDGDYVLEAENGIGSTVKHRFKITVEKSVKGKTGKSTKIDSRQQKSGPIAPVNEKGAKKVEAEWEHISTPETTDENVPRSTADSTSVVDSAQEAIADDQKRVSGSDHKLEPKTGPTGAGPTAPRIIEGLVDCSFTSRKPATLSVKAEGDEPLTATWSKDGNPLDSQYVQLLKGTHGSFTLYIKHVSATLRGKIKCVINDGNGLTAETEADVQISTVTGTDM